METEKYRALVTAIDTGSLAAAAEQLGYTTSGISRMVASLEKETGLTLLTRSKTGVKPTGDCEALLPSIRKFLGDAELLREQSASRHGSISGIVRVGTAYNYYYEPLASAIRKLTADYPDVSVEIISGYSTDLAEMLDNHSLDLSVMSRREHTGTWIPLLKDEMIAAVSRKNPLSLKKKFPVSSFTSEPYIATHPNSDSDSARVFAKYGMSPNTKYTTEDSMATFSMVSAGLGVTMNNRINAALFKNENIAILPLRPRQVVEIGIGVSDEAGPAVNSFVSAFLAEAKSSAASF